MWSIRKVGAFAKWPVRALKKPRLGSSQRGQGPSSLVGHLTTTSTPTPAASNVKSGTMIIQVPVPELVIAAIIKELPTGAVQTWEGLELLITGSDKPIYLFVVETIGTNPMLQFKHPKLNITMTGDILHYTLSRETICHRKFFNRNFLPTFFVFSNYLHAYAFEQKLTKAGYQVQIKKFE